MFSHRINDTQSYEFDPGTGLRLATFSGYDKDGNPRYTYKRIANFWPDAVSRITISRNNEKSTDVCLRLVFADDDGRTTVTLPLRGLDQTDWSNKVDARCLLNPDYRAAVKHIANLILSASRNVPDEKITVIERLGTNFVDGSPVFFAGNRLIWPTGLEIKPQVELPTIPNTRLAVDPSCSEQEADIGIEKIIDLSSEAGAIIFAHSLLFVMRTAFVTAGITPRCSVFLHGKTGVKKTTYAVFQTQIYNRDEPLEHPIRLNASIPAAVKLLYEKSDCTLVLDDLFPAQAGDIHRQQEKTLLEITRVIGDGIPPARMRGNQLVKEPPRCGVLFTGEYYIGTGSDAARLIPVELTTPIDNDKLSECQREPLMLSTFYNYFITWYISNFDGICDLIKEWITAYRMVKTGIHDRLQESMFCLEAAYKLLLVYRSEKGFISKEIRQEQYLAFYYQLNAIIEEQNVRVSQGSGNIPRPIEYIKIIRALYHDKRFLLVTRGEDFRDDKHDGIEYDDHLYLRRDRLLAKIRTIEPSAEFSDLLKYLKAHRALNEGADNSSRQIHGTNGARFYAIKLAKLR